MKKILMTLSVFAFLLLAAPNAASAMCNCVTVGDGRVRSEPRGCVADLAACNAQPTCSGGCQCDGECAAATEKPVGIPLPLGNVSVQGLVGRIIKTLLGLVGSFALIMFIYGGFMYMTSAGNDEKVTKGKNTLIWAILGLIMVFGAYAVVDFVIKTLNK